MSTNNGPDLTFATEIFERLMDDTCTIQRTDGEPLYNEFDRVNTQNYTLIYDGSCVFGNERVEQEGQSGADHVVSRYEVDIPIDGPDVLAQDIVTITSTRRDPAGVGLVLRVVGIVTDSFAVSRTLHCEVDR